MLKRTKAFTIIELLIGVAILSVTAFISIPIYKGYQTKLDTAIAVTKILNLQVAIDSFFQANDSHPISLADVNMDTVLDPWGNPYQYLNLPISPPGHARKDHAMVPINTDFDLYSMGPDGASVAPLTAAASRDDIVRANDVGFVGLSSDY